MTKKKLENSGSHAVSITEVSHGNWMIRDDRNVIMNFDGIEHVLILTHQYEQMVLISPLRSPPSNAVQLKKSDKLRIDDISG